MPNFLNAMTQVVGLGDARVPPLRAPPRPHEAGTRATSWAELTPEEMRAATTLGYGDHAPLSPRGRVAAAALALGSVGAAPAVVDAAHARLADAARALAGVRDDAPRRPKKRV